MLEKTNLRNYVWWRFYMPARWELPQATPVFVVVHVTYFEHSCVDSFMLEICAFTKFSICYSQVKKQWTISSVFKAGTQSCCQWCTGLEPQSPLSLLCQETYPASCWQTGWPDVHHRAWPDRWDVLGLPVNKGQIIPSLVLVHTSPSP